MIINGLTLDKLSDTQRETMVALRSMGGTGMRRDIANAAGITNMRLVTLALGRLETFGFVDQRNDRVWKCTAEGFGLFNEPAIPEPQACETPAIPEPEALSEPSEPEALSSQAIMQAELQQLMERKELPFSAEDAAWLCRSLSVEFSDMPLVSGLLGKMAEYWGTTQRSFIS